MAKIENIFHQEGVWGKYFPLRVKSESDLSNLMNFEDLVFTEDCG